MEKLTDKHLAFIEEVLAFLLYLETAMHTQNEMVAPTAIKGDLASSGVLYNNSIIISMAREIMELPYMKDYLESAKEAKTRLEEVRHQEVN